MNWNKNKWLANCTKLKWNQWTETYAKIRNSVWREEKRKEEIETCVCVFAIYFLEAESPPLLIFWFAFRIALLSFLSPFSHLLLLLMVWWLLLLLIFPSRLILQYDFFFYAPLWYKPFRVHYKSCDVIYGKYVTMWTNKPLDICFWGFTI